MYRIALVVIARNESARIARLLESVAPWVDRMVVLDTGSTDDTVDKAVACGAEVGRFAWCDDFAAARNAALDLASSDWHLVLDADEWLTDGGDTLRSFATIKPDFVGAIRLESLSGEAGAQRSHDWLSRLMPGTVRYRGRIHEQPAHSLPVRRLALSVHHEGYLPAALEAKRGRNRRMLAAELAQHPHDPYLWYQMGKDASVYKDHAFAESCFAKALERAPRDTPWRIDLIVRRFNALKNLARHAEVLGLASREEPHCADSPDFHFALGDVLLDWASRDPKRVMELLPRAEQAWLRCLDIGERPDLTGSVVGRGSRLAAHNLALIYEGTGRADRARSLRARYGLETRSLLS